MLANSFDKVLRRLAHRGLHTAPFASEPNPVEIADAFRDAIFADEPKQEFFGIQRNVFKSFFYSNDVAWTPDGDEAFDDGSYVLQFDIADQVRLIAFKCGNDGLHDTMTIRDLWIESESYYSVLERWREAFQLEWKTLPKEDTH